MPEKFRLTSTLKMYVMVASLTVVGIGILVLIGWFLDSPVLKSVLPGLATMKANAALLFIISGIALWLGKDEGAKRIRFNSMQICGGIVLLLALLTLAEYVLGLDFHIDQLLFTDSQTSLSAFPGRMSLTTALTFSLIGSAMILLNVEWKRGFRPAQYLALVAGSITLLALVGYLYDIQALYRVGTSAMALHSAIASALLAVGILCARPDRGWMKILLSETIAGVILRRLLPLAIGLPIVIGWLGLVGQRAGLYDTKFGLALIILLRIAVLTAIVWSNAKWLNRVDAERQQAEQQTHYQADLLQNISDAVVATDPDFTITSWNRAAEMLYAWSKDEALGKPSQDILQTEYLEEPELQTHERLLQHGVWQGEVIQKRRDGTRLNILASVSLLKDEAGKVIGAVTVNHDITAHKQAEEQFHLVVESAPNAIVLVNEQGRISLVNSQAGKFFGYNHAEMLGLQIDSLVPERYRGIHLGHRQNFLADPQTRSIGIGRDLYGVRKDGSEFPIEIGLTPLKTKEGLLVMATIVDIAERKRAEERQEFLMSASKTLASSLDYETTLTTVAQLAVPKIADWCTVYLTASDGSIEQVALTHAEPEKVKWALELQKRFPPNPNAPTGVAQVIRSGQAEFMPEIPAKLLEPIKQVPELSRLLDELQLTGTMTVPLTLRGRTLGAISLVSAESRLRYTTEDLELAEELARRMAVAVENARLYRSAQQLNEELEQRVIERTAELSESNTLLQAMLENIPDQIYFKDLQSRFIRNSRSQARLMGVDDPSEVIGKTDFDFFPHAQRSFDEEQALMKAAQPLIDLEEYVVWPDGRVTWVSTTKVPLRDLEGQVIGIMGISRDITERKQFEQNIQKLNEELKQYAAQLKESEEKFSKAFLASPAAMSIANATDGRYIDINEAMVEMTGYSREESLGHTSLELGLVDSEARGLILQSGQTRGFVRDVEIQIHTRSNQILDVLVSLEQIVLNGQTCMLTIQYDITERKRAEAEVRRLNQELEQRQIALETANKELEAFSYSVSHDLRAPLRSIDGFSMALLEDYSAQLPEKGQNYLMRVRTNAQRMAELIDDLLGLARVTRASVERTPVDLSALAENILGELQHEQPERQVKLLVTPGLTAEADANLLRIALTNLLNNAWKFTSKQAEAQIEFGLQEQNGEQIYFVRDNGTGFDMTYAGKLFGAFQRLHAVTEFPGTGIGLAIVQRVVHKHGGRVWAEGAVNQGATFYFTLS